MVIAAADAQSRLRRAAGLEVQVIEMLESSEASLPTDPSPDVLIIHPAAGSNRPDSGAAVVWVSEDAPDWADASLPDDENLDDALPSAITKALIARRNR